MSALENAKVIRAHFDAVNQRRIAQVAETINASDAAWTSVPAGMTFRGPAGYKQFLDVWLTAFPDARVEVESISAGDDFAVAEFRGVATHTGPLRTPSGEIPGTGKTIDLPFCEVYRLAGGRITSCRLYFDVMTLLRQIGVAG